MLLGGVSFSQTPQKISYQAVVRDNSGASVTNTVVGVRISILSGSSLGPEVFAETHVPTTNFYGLMNLQIGTGTNVGPALSSIDWGADVYFVKVEVDPTGGTSYSVSSVSQLLSVPYALHAETVSNADDADADPTNEYNTGVSLNGNDLEITDGGGTQTVDLTPLTVDPDMDASNEIQTLSKAGSVVSLSNGGGAFTDDVNDADADATNELNTTFTLVGTTLLLTDAGGTLNADLSGLTGDADPDPSNEIQTLSKAGSTVSLSLAGGSFTDEVDDADADPSNEFQQIAKVGNTVTLSDAGGSFIDEINDADADPANELQTIAKVSNIVTLSDGGGSFTVDDADADASNEFNTGATLTGTDLNITDGGSTITVDLSSLGGGVDPSATNELNTGFALAGTDLTITDAGGPLTVDLSSLGGGGNPTDELNTSVVLNGTNLETTDAGGTIITDLSPLVGGGDPSSVNELNSTVVLNGTNLETTDAGGTIITDLSSLQDGTGTDSQTLTFTNPNLSISGGNTVDLSALSGGGSSFAVGQHYQGGVIVWVDSSGIHGLIAALVDVGGDIEFEDGANSANYVGTSYTDGAANTAALVADMGAGTYAAKACDDYAGGGYTDWYLPSIYEMQIILDNNYVLGANACDWETFPYNYYWTSTQPASGFGLNAYTLYTLAGGVKAVSTTEAASANTERARPMRQF
jgi:hypothetical protein